MSAPEINFYHVMVGTTHQTAARLCEKIYDSNLRAVVVIDVQEELASFDHILWTFKQKSFVPHGSEKDGFVTDQPIWLTTEVENPNTADVLITLKPDPIAKLCDFKRVLDIFSGQDEDAVSLARLRWKTYKENGMTLNYWRQEKSTGKWEQVDL